MNEVDIAAPSLICVDWGSTNFRAFLLSDDGDVLNSVSADQGMLKLSKDEFEPFLMSKIAPWVETRKLPVLMAGMVGSQQGWYEADYLSCPAELSSLSRELTLVPNQHGLKVAIIPGMIGQSVSGQTDVMRGEEVQIYGALNLVRASEGFADQSLLCLPGTHTKWARVERCGGGKLTLHDFSTQMTGELHNVLLKHSILGRLSDSVDANEPSVMDSFDAGVSCAQSDGGVLHHIFSARSRVLAKQMAGQDVSSYLSGVLVGSEVKEMIKGLPETKVVYLVGNETLCHLYQRAIEKNEVKVVVVNGDHASYVGMLAIARQAELLNYQS